MGTAHEGMQGDPRARRHMAGFYSVVDAPWYNTKERAPAMAHFCPGSKPDERRYHQEGLLPKVKQTKLGPTRTCRSNVGCQG